jgi:hypothetical protein
MSKREQKRKALQILQRTITRLKLLLQGTTEAEEHARRELYMQLLLPVPALQVPAAHQPWYQEFQTIMSCLNQLGNPEHSKRITLEDILFYARMFDKLEARFKLQLAEVAKAEEQQEEKETQDSIEQ